MPHSTAISSDYGGAIAIREREELEANLATFEDNVAKSHGGAIHTNGNFQDKTLRSAATMQGGTEAPLVSGNSHASLHNVVFEENSAEQAGGALYLGEGRLRMHNATFDNQQ